VTRCRSITAFRRRIAQSILTQGSSTSSRLASGIQNLHTDRYITRSTRIPQLKTMGSARRKPSTPKTIGLCPLAAILLRCMGQCLETKRGGGPSTKEDLETVRFCVFVAPGLHRARTAVSTQLRNPGSTLTLDRQVGFDYVPHNFDRLPANLSLLC
jgi:hypothetical protein